MKTGNREIVSSLWWKILERFFTQGVNIVIQIILARILFPEDFGVMAIIVAITNYAGIFVQSGLSTAIVQKKNLEPKDVGTLLYCSMAVAAVLYVVLFFSAPILARNYEMPQLIWPLRVVAAVLFFNAINSIQTALYFRQMRFKALFFRSALAVPISGVVGITMAYAGYGVWALVAYTLTNILTIIIYMSLDKNARLSFGFSWEKAKSLYSFSGKIMISNLVSGFGDTLRTMVIGKRYSANDLAYYDKAYTYSNYVTSSITQSLSTVLLPSFSRQQDNMDYLRDMARKSIRMTAFLIFPVLIAVAVMAKPIILLLLTAKWAESIPFLMVFCILRMPGCITTIDKQVFYAIGNSAINMWYEVLILVLNIVMLYITVPIGIMAIAIGATVNEMIGCTIIFIISKKMYKYGLFDRVKDLIGPICYSLVMAALLYFIGRLGLSNIITICIQIVVGVVAYFGIAILFKDKNVNYLKIILRNKFNSRNQ